MMKLSGHTYNNAIFESLMDNLAPDVVYTKAAQKTTPPQASPITGMDVFSSTTEDTLHGIHQEEFDAIVGELHFAADRARVDVSRDDLIDFVHEARREGLRGKKLERAAQKFCNKIAHTNAPPIGTTRNSHSSNLLDNANNKAVIPAGYNTEYGQNDTTTSGYMGMSKNPNSIWDSNKLAELALKPQGDEQIRASKKAQKDFADSQKQQYWEDLQKQLSDKGIILSKTASVANVSTVETTDNSKKVGTLPANSMSMFSDNRNFENIPEQTAGETLKESAENRSMKKDASRPEWDKSAPHMKTNHRVSLDRMFDGLADYFEGKGK